MGGVLMNESITRAAGAAHGQEVSASRMVQLIEGKQGGQALGACRGRFDVLLRFNCLIEWFVWFDWVQLVMGWLVGWLDWSEPPLEAFPGPSITVEHHC